MASYNKVLLMGNLTADPQLKHNPSGLAVANFTLAINSKYSTKEQGVKEEVGFFEIVVFGKQAENCASYLNKGRSVFVDGRLAMRRWEAPDGTKRSKVYVIAQRVQFLGGKPTGGAISDDFSNGSDSDIIEDLPLEEDIPF
ncbi:MAG: single-stranded DNA-binding protein [Proteobacteria bacterium]|nr:single-stranded DNA-binding protein [Pseudomonadota bacterium]